MKTSCGHMGVDSGRDTYWLDRLNHDRLVVGCCSQNPSVNSMSGHDQIPVDCHGISQNPTRVVERKCLDLSLSIFLVVWSHSWMRSSWRRDVLSNSCLHSCCLCIPVNDDDPVPTRKDPLMTSCYWIDIHRWNMFWTCCPDHTLYTLASFVPCPTHFTDLP